MNIYFKNAAVFVCVYLFSIVTVLVTELVNDPDELQQYSDWPREIQTTEGVVIVYQPQPESLDGHLLKGRAAVAVERWWSPLAFSLVTLNATLSISSYFDCHEEVPLIWS